MRDHVSSLLSRFEIEKPGARTARLIDRLRAWGSLLRHLKSTPARSASEAQESITLLQSVLSNPAVRERLRGYYAERCGSANVEFLIGYWTFTRSTNALGRYQQLRTIIHTLVRDGSPQTITLNESTRRRLLRDWEKWSGGTRVPAGVKLRGLDAAAAEIQQSVRSQDNSTHQRAR